jgi:hypothetical protein
MQAPAAGSCHSHAFRDISTVDGNSGTTSKAGTGCEGAGVQTGADDFIEIVDFAVIQQSKINNSLFGGL